MSNRLVVSLVWVCAALGGMTIVASAIFASSPECSHKQVLPGTCGQGRTCPAYNSSTNNFCSGTFVWAQNVNECSSVGAVAADNCVRSTQEEICAVRYNCVKERSGGSYTCWPTAIVVGVSMHYKVEEGGTCFVE